MSGFVREEWRGGWKTVFAGFFGVGTTWNMIQIIMGVFIVPMQAEFGWSRSAIAFGPIAAFISILFYLPAGLLVDKWGARRVALTGMPLLGLSLLLMSTATPNPLYFYSIVALFGMAGAISNSIIFSRGVASWFVRNFGTALGLLMTGISLVGAVVFPVLSSIIAHSGWRAGWVFMAAIIFLVGLPLVWLWFRSQDDVIGNGDGQDKRVPDGLTTFEAMRDKRFWILVAAIGMAALPIGGFLSHLQPLLVGRGMTVQVAAAYGTVFVFAIGIGRIIVGSLMDRANPAWVAGGTMVLSALGTYCLGHFETGAAVSVALGLAVGFIGLAQGAESDYLSFFSRRFYGMRSFGRIVAVMALVASAGMAGGGVIFAALFDHFGNYNVAVDLAAAGYFVSGLLMLSVKVPPAGTYVEVRPRRGTETQAGATPL